MLVLKITNAPEVVAAKVGKLLEFTGGRSRRATDAGDADTGTEG